MPANTPVRLLCATRNPVDAGQLRVHFERQAPDFALDFVDTTSACLERLQFAAFDLLLIGHEPPELDGLEILEALSCRGRTVPAVMTIDAGDEEVAARALRVGVDACVRRDADYITRLPGALSATALRRLRDQADVDRIIRAAGASLDLRTVLDQALRGVLDLVGLEGGTLCLVEDQRQSLQLAAAVNASAETIADLTTHVIKIGDCLCGECARTGEPLVIWDHASASPYATREATRNEGIRFHAAFPMTVKERCVAVLCVFARSDRKPSWRQLHLLQDLCRPLALLVEHARLFQAAGAAREQAEAARAQLADVFERVTDAFVALDKNWRYTYVNTKAADIFGRRAEDLLGRHIWTEFPEGIGQPFHRAYERAMADQAPVRFEDYYPPYDRWFENIVYPSPEGLSIYFHDITVRKHAETALLESEERLRLALDAAHMGTFDWDLANNRITWSRWHEELWGFEPGEFTGTYEAFSERVHPDDRPGVDADVERSLAAREPFTSEYRVVWPDGGVHWVMGRGEFTFDDDGRPLRMRGVVVETTARKLAEEALREREERLRLVLDGLGPQMFVGLLDTDGAVLMVNRPAMEAAGLRTEDVISRPVQDTYWFAYSNDVRQRLRAAIQRAAKGESVRYDEQVRVAQSQFIWLDFSVQPLCDESGRIVFLVPSGNVITERKQAEQHISQLNEELQRHAADLEQRVADRTAELETARERAESADRLKSAFLASMSHELRTPLNSIIGFTGILLQGLAGPLNEEQTKQLGMVKSSGQHLLALINDILDISKIEAGQIEVRLAPFDLEEAIERAVRSVAPQLDRKHLSLTTHVDPGIGDITSDRRRVEQILLNLLSNAVKFTDRGDIRLTAEPLSGAVRISVTDTGIGIKPDDLTKLFQPFHQLESGLARQHDGTGLGLAICKKLVERLGGTIWAESEWGHGSAFHFTLPVRSGS